MDQRLRIIGFLFFDFFKVLTDLEYLILTVKLFHSFMQYGKKIFLKNFVLDKRADTDLKE